MLITAKTDEDTTDDFTNIFDDRFDDRFREGFNNGSGRWAIPLEATERMANLTQLSRSEHYCVGIAKITMDTGQPMSRNIRAGRAIINCKKALELNPSGWIATKGLARSYGDHLREYGSAVYWAECAISHLPRKSDFAATKLLLQTSICGWHLEAFDDEKALQTAQAAYRTSRDFHCGDSSIGDEGIYLRIRYYIEALYRAKKYLQIIESLFELDEKKTKKQGKSLWIAYLQGRDGYSLTPPLLDRLGRIMQSEKNETLHGFMKTSFRNVIKPKPKSTKDERSVYLAIQAAERLYRYKPWVQESFELTVNVLTLVDQSNETIQQDQAEFRTQAAALPGMILLYMSIQAFDSNEDASPFIKDLENLACRMQGHRRYYRESSSALLLGYWMRQYSKAEREVWIACIKPSIRLAYSHFDDEDSWNELYPYMELGRALLAAGDIRMRL